jgi:WhiB family redox-sensing transcriptional regulator
MSEDFVSPEPWMVDGNCKDVEDPDIFFSSLPADVQAAKGLCTNCPVRLLCVAYAIDNDITDGIFGGLSEADRRQIKSAKLSRRNIPNRKH